VERLDWKRIADWSAGILEGRLDPIAAEFRGHGASPPEVVLGPTAEQVAHEPLRFLLSHWSELAGGGLPHFRRVDALALGPALGYVMLLDVVDGALDFRYRLFGSKIARISDFDMTGRLLSEHTASAYMVEFLIALYRSAVRERRPLYANRHTVGSERTAAWQQLALPLCDDAGAVVRLLAGTVAVGYDGRMIRA
jgi:hypothetical protein